MLALPKTWNQDLIVIIMGRIHPQKIKGLGNWWRIMSLRREQNQFNMKEK